MLLTARWLFTGVDDHLLEDHVVRVEEGRIVEVRPRSARAGGEPIVDHGEATLLPGLIDVHQHLAFDASPTLSPSSTR